jgi:hypothetical protein
MMETGQNLLQDDLLIDNEGQIHLKETAMWAKFLGIAGFLGSGILALAAVFAGTFIGKISRGLQGRGDAAMAGGMVMIFYLVVAAIIFFMSLYLYRFSTKMQVANRPGKPKPFFTEFKNILSFFRYPYYYLPYHFVPGINGCFDCCHDYPQLKRGLGILIFFVDKGIIY